MKGKQTNEYDIPFSAEEVWEVYSTLTLASLFKKTDFLKDQAVYGDGSVGTRFYITVNPGPISSYWEVIRSLDHENRIKEVDVTEGGVLEKGYTFFRTVFQILDKGPNCCTVRSMFLYEIKDEEAENEKLTDVNTLEPVARAVEKYLTDKHAGAAAAAAAHCP